MNRGMNNQRTLWLLLLGFVIAGWTTLTQAGSAGRHNNATTGKRAAPSIEDEAAYFSTYRQGVPLEDLKKADELRLRTVASIKALLEGKANEAQRFELLLRLGELYVERHDYLRDLEMREYSEKYRAWEKADRKGKEPALNTQGSRGELTQAANAFRSLVSEHPKHPGVDAALFALAKTLTRLGNDNAVLYLQQLINGHPKSQFIPEAHLAMGEYYFDKHQMEKATDAYKEAMKYKESRVYPYAVYKLGWCYYNANAKNDKDEQENLKKSVTAFKLVVKLSDRDTGKLGNLNLRDEAINDLIMVWADAGDVDSAWNYFKTIDQQESFYKMLERLGWIYADQGKDEKAIAVYERLLTEAPTRPSSPETHVKLAGLHEQQGNVIAVTNDLQAMQLQYTGQGAWKQANKNDPDAIEDAERTVEKNLHRYGALFHQRGQKTKKKTYLEAAATIYKLHLAAFPQNENAYEIRYYLADILFDFGQFEAASAHYTIVAKAKKDGKYLKTAALQAVVAMNNVVNATKYAKLPPPGQALKPIDIPDNKRKLVDVIDNFVTLLPNDKEGEPMRFTAAQIFFDHGHYDEAIKRFDRIVTDIPKTKQAEASVRVILSYYGDKEDWTNVITWARKFSKSKDAMTPALAKYVGESLREASFKKALAFEKGKQPNEAANAFLQYQTEFPKDDNADRALYNAMLNFYQAGKVDNALAAGTKLMEEYPKSKLRSDVVASLGQTYEAIGQFEKAAEMYYRLATQFTNDKRANSALYNAAVLYKGLNKIDMAVKLFDEFRRRYPHDKEVNDAEMEIAALQERQGNYGAAQSEYRSLSDSLKKTQPEDALFAEAKVAEIAAFKLNQARGKGMLESLEKRLTSLQNKPAFEARQIVAQGIFRLMETEVTNFKAVKFENPSAFTKDVQNKQARLVNLAQEYEKIINIGNAEYTVASLYRLGELHEDFAQKLFKAPAPVGASNAELDAFKTAVEKVAFPLRDEAKKFFETAYQRSKEVETFSAWTQRTYQKMTELSPEKYPEVLEHTTDAEYMAHRLVKDQAVEPLAAE